MTRKEKLLIEVYRLKNRIAELLGEQRTNIEEFSHSWRFVREARDSKEYELKEVIERLKKSYAKTVEDRHISEARMIYFATETGAAHKERLEKNLEMKIAEWKQTGRQAVATLEGLLQHLLGAHWGVGDFSSNYSGCSFTLGIVDEDKSTDERRVFIFGQTATIYYNEETRGYGKERFEINIGTCGSCSLFGGDTEGEHARFYIGIGRLFADRGLLERLRDMMRESSHRLEALAGETDTLRTELKNPLAKQMTE